MSGWVKVGTKVRCCNRLGGEGGVPAFEVGTAGRISGVWGAYVQVSDGLRHVDMLRGDMVYFWEPVGDAPPARERPKRPMIVHLDPSRPGKDIGELKYIGYWASSPDPDADEYEAKEVLLPWPHDHVDGSWAASFRDVVVQYLRAGSTVENWRGQSWCRFEERVGCGRERPPCLEGSSLGYRDLGDGTYVWPEGFAHYVEKHGVRPPEEFVRHVLRKLGFFFDG